MELNPRMHLKMETFLDTLSNSELHFLNEMLFKEIMLSDTAVKEGFENDN